MWIIYQEQPSQSYSSFLLLNFPRNLELTSPKHSYDKPFTMPIIIIQNTVPRRYHKIVATLLQCEMFVLDTAGGESLTRLPFCQSGPTWEGSVSQTQTSLTSQKPVGIWMNTARVPISPPPGGSPHHIPQDQSPPRAPTSRQGGAQHGEVLSSHLQWQSKYHGQDYA